MMERNFFEKILLEVFGRSIRVFGSHFKSGGCINNTLQLQTTEGDFFIKWQSNIPEDMFEKEAAGLKALKHVKSLPTGQEGMKIPEVLAVGKIEEKHYLLMEYIDSAPPSANYWEDFGHSLAELHQQKAPKTHGFQHDNYIGKLPQPNRTFESWIGFFIQNRLEYQLNLAIANRMVSDSFIRRYRQLYGLLPELLPEEKPSLLHGDLWSGNVMVGNDGKVCLIDPAVYYGHREIELAFTRMFGGFSQSFYDAYHETYPLAPEFEERVGIYNIYPHMVHVNLFGSSYLSGVEQVLRKYV